MKWKFDNDRPIYLQIVEQFKQSILSGEAEPGEKLMTVRELAADAGVNPNTMQRALAELERDGLMYTNRTSGRYITDDKAVIDGLKKRFAKKKLEKFLDDMERIGLGVDETIELLREYGGRKNG